MKQIKPVPYITRIATPCQKQDAAIYRQKFVPLIKRRLKNHHLAGFRADFITGYIADNKKNYPFFIRADIRLFYPNIRHSDIHRHVVLAYKQLLSAPRIPVAFERWSRPVISGFLSTLPCGIGLPLGNALSGILAPLMLVPLWLDIRKRFNVPFIVYMDDVLFFARSSSQAAHIYEYLCFRLEEDYGLHLNPEKTVSGRFSDTPFDYCGWHLAGGYASVSESKLEAFRQRFNQRLTNCRQKPLRAYLKSLNRGIDGFGNHYKQGNTGRQFAALDKWIRRQVRRSLPETYAIRHITNSGLEDMGLHSLYRLYRQCHKKQGRLRPLAKPLSAVRAQVAEPGKTSLPRIEVQLEKLAQQQSLLTGIMRKQLNELRKLNELSL